MSYPAKVMRVGQAIALRQYSFLLHANATHPMDRVHANIVDALAFGMMHSAKAWDVDEYKRIAAGVGTESKKATVGAAKILCGCGDIYEYPMHDGLIDVGADNRMLCQNCAMTADERPVDTCGAHHG